MMGDVDTNEVHTVGNHEENRDKEIQPIKLIPQGFVVDDAPPSISIEDIEEGNDFWLVDIPEIVNPNKLLGLQLDFRQEMSFIIDEQTNETCISLPSRETSTAICLFSTHQGISKKLVALNPSGQLSINVSYDVPEFGAMIPESSSVQLPVGLKVRHPFLGPKYKEIVKSMEGIQENIQMSEKNALPNESTSADLGSTEKGEILNVTTVKNEIYTPKKSKKRKLQSLHEDESSGVDYFSTNAGPLAKKHKKEKQESAHFQETGYLEKEKADDELELFAEEDVSVKKKKDKKKASKVVQSELNAVSSLEHAVDAPHDQLQTPKKIKKEKNELEFISGMEQESDVPQVELQKKERKKKKGKSESVTEVGQNEPAEIELYSGEIETLHEGDDHFKKRKKDKKGISEVISELDVETLGKELVDIPDTPVQTPKKKKKKIKEEPECMVKEERLTDVSLIGSSVPYEISEETSKKAKKKKKRDLEHEIEQGYSDMVSEVKVEDISMTAGRQGKEEVEEFNKGVEVLTEEVSHTKMKRKKDKKRASEVISELDFVTMEKELVVIPGTPEQTPKKKKKIKEESEYIVKEEGLADVSLTGSSVPSVVSEEIHKKAKKKKKRDSEYGVEEGHGDMLSEDVTKVEEMSEQTPEVEGKRKKEKWYFDHNPTILEPYNDIKNPHVKKKGKKVFGETGVHQGEGNSCANYVTLSSDSENKILKGKSHHKKRQSLLTHGMETQLLSPKKEKKTKKESLG